MWDAKLLKWFILFSQRYIQVHKYRNANAEELWDAIGEVIIS